MADNATQLFDPASMPAGSRTRFASDQYRDIRVRVYEDVAIEVGPPVDVVELDDLLARHLTEWGATVNHHHFDVVYDETGFPLEHLSRHTVDVTVVAGSTEQAKALVRQMLRDALAQMEEDWEFFMERSAARYKPRQRT